MRALAALLAFGCSCAFAQDVLKPWDVTKPLSIGAWATGTTTNVMPVVTLSDSCVIASISADDANVVTVDWGCVERRASEYKDGKGDIFPAFALIMKAIRDGTAKTK